MMSISLRISSFSMAWPTGMNLAAKMFPVLRSLHLCTTPKAPVPADRTRVTGLLHNNSSKLYFINFYHTFNGCKSFAIDSFLL